MLRSGSFVCGLRHTATAQSTASDGESVWNRRHAFPGRPDFRAVANASRPRPRNDGWATAPQVRRRGQAAGRGADGHYGWPLAALPKKWRRHPAARRSSRMCSCSITAGTTSHKLANRRISASAWPAAPRPVAGDQRGRVDRALLGDADRADQRRADGADGAGPWSISTTSTPCRNCAIFLLSVMFLTRAVDGTGAGRRPQAAHADDLGRAVHRSRAPAGGVVRVGVGQGGVERPDF